MPHTIHIVDDSQMNVKVLRLSLAQYDYVVQVSYNANTALAEIKASSPDLILLDILMPDIDGYTLCTQIKADPNLQDIPIIFLTSLTDVINKVRAFQAGAVDFLTKPVDPDEMLARVSTHILLYEQRREIERLLRKRTQAEAIAYSEQAMTRALLDCTLALNSTLELDDLLARILENVGQVIEHDMALLMLVEGQSLQIANMTTPPESDWTVVTPTFHIKRVSFLQQIVESRRTALIDRIPPNSDWYAIIPDESIQACIAAPILAQDTVTGILALFSRQPYFYTVSSVGRLEAFTVHASIALQNAKMYRQGQELAVMQERQRIARELHDAVSQSLFSINVISEALPHVEKKNPAKLESYMQQLISLTRGAMAEMRALLVELRPESLMQTDLGQLLRQLSLMFTNNTNIPVEVSTSQSMRLNPSFQIVYYRIAQESLANIVKHSRATHVKITLHMFENEVEMSIEDDGVGFDLAAVPPTHFGLSIMQERAQSIGASLKITSILGQGTLVRLRGEYQ